jgi:hypothetical protein
MLAYVNHNVDNVTEHPVSISKYEWNVQPFSA